MLSISRFVSVCVCAREYSLSNLSFSMYLTVSSVFHYSLVRYSRALLLPTPLLLSSRVTPLSRSRSKVSPVIVLLFNFFSLKCFKQFLYSVCVLSIAACCFSTIPPCVCVRNAIRPLSLNYSWGRLSRVLSLLKMIIR